MKLIFGLCSSGTGDHIAFTPKDIFGFQEKDVWIACQSLKVGIEENIYVLPEQGYDRTFLTSFIGSVRNVFAIYTCIMSKNCPVNVVEKTMKRAQGFQKCSYVYLIRDIIGYRSRSGKQTTSMMKLDRLIIDIP